MKITPILKYGDNNTTISIKAKDVIIHKTAFQPPLTSSFQQVIIFAEYMPTQIIIEIVSYTLKSPFPAKVSRLDKLNFGIL